MVMMSREVGPHAEEKELRKLEQMASCLFPLWIWQMSNGSNYITGRGDHLGHL